MDCRARDAQFAARLGGGNLEQQADEFAVFVVQRLKDPIDTHAHFPPAVVADDRELGQRVDRDQFGVSAGPPNDRRKSRCNDPFDESAERGPAGIELGQGTEAGGHALLLEILPVRYGDDAGNHSRRRPDFRGAQGDRVGLAES